MRLKYTHTHTHLFKRPAAGKAKRALRAAGTGRAGTPFGFGKEVDAQKLNKNGTTTAEAERCYGKMFKHFTLMKQETQRKLRQ